MNVKNSNKEKVNIIKDKALQGTDCYIFEIVSEKKPDYFSPIDLFNSRTEQYGSIYSQKGKTFVSLVLPRIVRGNNIQPFTLADDIDTARGKVHKTLVSFFGPDFRGELHSIECNITKEISGNATISEILNLLSHALLSDKKDNIKYIGPDSWCKLKEETHSTISKNIQGVLLKAYDKTEQMGKKICVYANTPILPDDVLRIEIVFKRRAIKKLFKNKLDIEDILTYESLLKVVKEYKRIFSAIIFDGHVMPYLKECERALLESLHETNKVETTIAKMHECIPDNEVLYRAIKQWNKDWMISDHALRDTRKYTKKYDLPQDIILTLNDFKKSCG